MERYELVIKQYPKVGRVCSLKDRVDRRPLDPPPIVQINSKETCDQTHLHSPYLCLRVNLISPEEEEVKLLNDIHTPIVGNTLQSIHRLKGLDQKKSGFFIFPDLSIRSLGLFRLKFSLYEIKDKTLSLISSLTGDVIDIINTKPLTLLHSTPLTLHLHEQGMKLKIHKDPQLKYKKYVSTNTKEEIDKSHKRSPSLISDTMSTLLTIKSRRVSNNELEAFLVNTQLPYHIFPLSINYNSSSPSSISRKARRLSASSEIADEHDFSTMFDSFLTQHNILRISHSAFN